MDHIDNRTKDKLKFFLPRFEFSTIENLAQLLRPLKTGSVSCDSTISMLKLCSKFGALFSTLFHHLPPAVMHRDPVE